MGGEVSDSDTPAEGFRSCRLVQLRCRSTVAVLYQSGTLD